MTNVEFWTEVVSMTQKNMDEDNLTPERKDTLDRVFERANNELIVAMNS